MEFAEMKHRFNLQQKGQMDRQFETTVDDQGHFDIPAEVRARHGFTNGAKVRIEERNSEIAISPVESEPSAQKRMIEAIDRAVGLLGNDGNLIKALMDERREEHERDATATGS